MIELHSAARSEAVTLRQGFLAKLRSPMWCGIAGLGLGAILTWLAVEWSHATLSLLSLVVVFGSLFSVSLGLMRHLGTRFRRN
jgi:hypothetical protein